MSLKLDPQEEPDPQLYLERIAKLLAIGNEMPIVVVTAAVGFASSLPETVTTDPTRRYWHEYAAVLSRFATDVSVGVYVPLARFSAEIAEESSAAVVYPG